MPIHCRYMLDTTSIHLRYSCRYIADTLPIHCRYIADTCQIQRRHICDTVADTLPIHCRYIADTLQIQRRYICDTEPLMASYRRSIACVSQTNKVYREHVSQMYLNYGKVCVSYAYLTCIYRLLCVSRMYRRCIYAHLISDHPHQTNPPQTSRIRAPLALPSSGRLASWTLQLASLSSS